MRQSLTCWLISRIPSKLSAYSHFRSTSRVVAVLLLASVICSPAQSKDRPIIMYLVDEKTGRQSGGLTDAQVDDIVRFIKTVRGIDHHVQEINATSPPEVVVHTGRYRNGSGDLLHIQEHNGHWSIIKRAKWTLVVEPSRRKGVSPFVYEEQH
jgi:hypothetical protein